MVDGTLRYSNNEFRRINECPRYSEHTLNLTCRLRTELEASRQPVTFQEIRKKRDFVIKNLIAICVQNERLSNLDSWNSGRLRYTGLEERGREEKGRGDQLFG